MTMKKLGKAALCLAMILTLLCGAIVSASADEWVNSNGRWWYRYKNGSYPRNEWKQIGGAWYHFDASGWMQTGFQTIDGQRYYFSPSGAMVTGWFQANSNWYLALPSGALATGWQQIKGKWYWFNRENIMATGWKYVSDYEVYYFYEDGSMASGTYVDGIRIDRTGYADVLQYVNPRSITVRKGDIETVNVRFYGPDDGYVTYEIENNNICICDWSSWNGDDIKLYIRGKNVGTTYVYVFNSENDLYDTIVVTVVP